MPALKEFRIRSDRLLPIAEPRWDFLIGLVALPVLVLVNLVLWFCGESE